MLVGAGTVLRLLDLAGVGPLPDLPGVAAVIVPLLGLIELRRIGRTLLAVGRRQQRRLVYRFEGDAPAQCFSEDGHVPGRLIDASAAGVGLVLEAPLEVGATPAVLLQLEDAAGEPHEVAAQVEVRSCREAGGPPPGRRDDHRDRLRLAHAADGVVLRRLQPRAPARPPPGGADRRSATRSCCRCRRRRPPTPQAAVA